MSHLNLVKTSLVLRNASGDPIHGDLRCVRGMEGGPLIVICHSFMAFKDWGFFPHLAGRLSLLGYPTFAFNFSHGGAGSGKKISDFVAFEKNTFSKELEDLRAVTEAFRGAIPGIRTIWDPSRIVLLGHSRGGGMAILHAGRDGQVFALVSLAAIATLDRWTEHQKAIWRKDGVYLLSRNTKASPLRLGVGLLDDLENNREILDIPHASSRVHCPWLIVHGEVDLTVPVREARELFDRSNREKTTLKLIPRAGHLFNASTRSEDGYAMLDSTIDAVHDWLHSHC